MAGFFSRAESHFSAARFHRPILAVVAGERFPSLLRRLGLGHVDPLLAAIRCPIAVLGRLMDGYLTTQLLYVAVKLGIAEALAAGPLNAEAVAAVVGAQPDAVRRVLRGLAAERIILEGDDGRFDLGPVGTYLRADVVGSLRGAMIARGDLYFTAAGGLLEVVSQPGAGTELRLELPLRS